MDVIAMIRRVSTTWLLPWAPLTERQVRLMRRYTNEVIVGSMRIAPVRGRRPQF